MIMCLTLVTISVDNDTFKETTNPLYKVMTSVFIFLSLDLSLLIHHDKLVNHLL